ncbi:metallophosphoesterase [Solimonas variicoloris]|uniref:metallophosphoesterase n=1 Tax=Solimonas variicoloris TaxID=254408 RepID=UPI0003725A1F|nr:metallophosphoesterase [Solimonas variicoloris]
MNKWLWTALLSCTLAACGGSSGGGESGTGKARFIALGDTGAPAPDGEADNVAKVVAAVCAQRGCDFATMAGDNIYETGADSADDPIFQAAFETPYQDLDFPFFVALGNHDNSLAIPGGGGANARGDAQVDYAMSAHNAAGKWVMPARYYSVTWPRDASTPLAEFFVIDSSPITHYLDDPNAEWRGDALQAYIAEQQTFLQDGMAASQARWKFALAHHPYISNGDHGNAGDYERGSGADICVLQGVLVSGSCRGADYKAFLEQTICDQADIFLNGHDHNLYWLKPVAGCGKTQHILSGAGSKARSTLDAARNEAYFQTGDSFGFFWIELDGDTARVAVYTVKAGGEPAQVDAAGRPAPAYEMSFRRQAS